MKTTTTTTTNIILAVALIVVTAQAYWIQDLAATNERLVRAVAELLQLVTQNTTYI